MQGEALAKEPGQDHNGMMTSKTKRRRYKILAKKTTGDNMKRPGFELVTTMTWNATAKVTGLELTHAD